MEWEVRHRRLRRSWSRFLLSSPFLCPFLSELPVETLDRNQERPQITVTTTPYERQKKPVVEVRPLGSGDQENYSYLHRRTNIES